MAKSLEGMYKKSLDANVERDGAREIDWDKDDNFVTITDIDFDEDIDRKIFESEGIRRGILESQNRESYESLLNFNDIAQEQESYESTDYSEPSLSDLERERAQLEAELIAARGESEELKEKITALDKRLEQAKILQQEMQREAMMEVEDAWLR